MQSRIRKALIGVSAATLIAGGIAFAQTQDPPAAPDQAQGQHEPMHPWGGVGARIGLRIADRLATLHTYLGITPQQEGAWNDFAQAAIAMAPQPGERHGMEHMGAFEGIDHMAQHIQDLGQKAQKLDQAAQALKGVLTPDQIKKADAVWAERMAMREHHWHEWMHRWMHHDEDEHHDD
jgi:periplasmic protein CpxP/Spy